MPHLFSYGTLQSEAVQLVTFGRRLKGKADRLIGYRVTLILTGIPTGIGISDHKPDTNGASYHRNIQSTGGASDVVEGTVFMITKDELGRADAYERNADYERALVRLASSRWRLTEACRDWAKWTGCRRLQA